MKEKRYIGFEDREDVVKTIGDSTYSREQDKWLYTEPKSLPPDEDILLACHEAGSYDGSLMIVYRKNGKLWCHQDSHCSCNGFEAEIGGGEVTMEWLVEQLLREHTMYELQQMPINERRVLADWLVENFSV